MRGTNHVVRTHWWLAQGTRVLRFITSKTGKISIGTYAVKTPIKRHIARKNEMALCLLINLQKYNVQISLNYSEFRSF